MDRRIYKGVNQIGNKEEVKIYELFEENKHLGIVIPVLPSTPDTVIKKTTAEIFVV